MLVYYGANTYIPNNQGRTPRDISTGYQGYPIGSLISTSYS